MLPLWIYRLLERKQVGMIDRVLLFWLDIFLFDIPPPHHRYQVGERKVDHPILRITGEDLEHATPETRPGKSYTSVPRR
jgi:hypothetical protein